MIKKNKRFYAFINRGKIFEMKYFFVLSLLISACTAHEDRDDKELLTMRYKLDSLDGVILKLNETHILKDQMLDSLQIIINEKENKLIKLSQKKTFTDDQVVSAFKAKFEFINPRISRREFKVVNEGKGVFLIAYYWKAIYNYNDDLNLSDQYYYAVYKVKLNEEGTNLESYNNVRGSERAY